MGGGTVFGLVYDFPRSLPEGTPWIEARATDEPRALRAHYLPCGGADCRWRQENRPLPRVRENRSGVQEFDGGNRRVARNTALGLPAQKKA